MSEVSKDQDQETSYKETFRWDSSIGSKTYCQDFFHFVFLYFCLSGQSLLFDQECISEQLQAFVFLAGCSAKTRRGAYLLMR